MQGKITIYTDGASRGNPGPGGYGAIVISNLKSNISDVREIGGREEKTTNNRMEMMAAIRALESVPEEAQVELHTDSSYLINGITKWVYGWQSNGWKTKDKQDVLNKDLWQWLLDECGRREVEWQKVSGHSGHSYNDRCDTIATMFADAKDVKLYEGDKDNYKVEPSKGGGMNRSKAKAYSYISAIDGDVKVHKTWAECKERVEGKKARFKKALTPEEESEIIREFRN